MKSVPVLIAAAAAGTTGAASLPAKAAFVGVFVVLLVWLLFLPARLIDQEEVRKPWWRNVRFWAVVVTIAQIWVYFYWG